MPRHAMTCDCEHCERDGTGDFAMREAAELAGTDDTEVSFPIFLRLVAERERSTDQTREAA